MEQPPFSTRLRGIELGSLPQGYAYAFDYSAPSGVKLIPPGVLSELGGLEHASSPKTASAFGKHADAIQANPFASTENKHLAVWMHVINGCNFACHYCYIPHLNRSVDRSLLQEHSLKQGTIHPILSSLLNYCDSEGLSELKINFAGGEPTLNLPLVEDFCKEAINLGGPIKVTFGMITNGSFDASELIPLIQRYRIQLSVSIDGHQDSHDRIRFEVENGKKVGSWERIIGNISALIEAGVLPYFLYTVTPSNFLSIEKFSTYAHDLRLGFRLSLVRSARAVKQELQVKIANEICRLYDLWAESLDGSLPIQKCAAFAEWNLYKTKYVPCSSCRNYFAIDTFGEVSTCQMRMDKTYGNASSESFSSIVSRAKADPINVSLSDPVRRKGVCIRCQYFHVCASGCPQHNLNSFGDMDRQSPWCHVYGSVMPRYIRAIARQLQRVSSTT